MGFVRLFIRVAHLPTVKTVGYKYETPLGLRKEKQFNNNKTILAAIQNPNAIGIIPPLNEGGTDF